MKVTIFLLVAVACFAVINAAPSEQTPVDLFDDELFWDDIFDDDMYELQMYNIFSPFFWFLKAALRTLKGVNCTIKEVIIIKFKTIVFLKRLQACGADAVNTFKNVIASSNKVIAICNNIIHLSENEKLCNNNKSTNGKTSWSCIYKLFKQLYLLRKQINITLQAIKKVPTVPGDAAYCTNSALNLLIDDFKSFPSNIKTCSKLKN